MGGWGRLAASVPGHKLRAGADLIPPGHPLLGWLGMFGGAAQQILPLVLAQHQIALVLAQDVGTQLVPGQVLDVVTGAAIPAK